MNATPFSLAGKSILVTGASSGIGKAIAIECSRMGGTVIATARDEERLKHTISSLDGDGHKYIICDLTDEVSMSNLIASLPKLDGLVLCAGLNQTLPLGFQTRKKVDNIFNINFFSQVELLRLIIKKKLLSEGASVVALSSIGGTSVFTPGASAYGASKAALLSWMKTAARELAPRIRVNCICPGQVNTPMNAQGEIEDEKYEEYRQTIPMKRFAEPEEIAYGVIYLLSVASRWVTGSVITIDGGTTLQ